MISKSAQHTVNNNSEQLQFTVHMIIICQLKDLAFWVVYDSGSEVKQSLEGTRICNYNKIITGGREGGQGGRTGSPMEGERTGSPVEGGKTGFPGQE